MSDKKNRLEPKLPRGFADREAADIRAVERMMETIKRVYERYGFEPVETPFVEYTEALGKFLPDQDRPNEGVFSFQDEDEAWLSLRYDLTAPLARYVAENYERLPKPYRSYRSGWVFRNEKPGPGRFKQFMQFDADTVGAASPAADAEICMMAADTMKALGFDRGDYVIKVNNRKILDGVMEGIGVRSEAQKLAVLRALDKRDRLGTEAVAKLLGKEGRTDQSGDHTKGAGLDIDQIEVVLAVANSLAAVSADPSEEEMQRRERMVGQDRAGRLAWGLPLHAGHSVLENETFAEGTAELSDLQNFCVRTGYLRDRIRIDPSVVRGLEYYTGPVFEAELTFDVENEKGQPVVFGSVGGGGRYDGLVGRFRNEDVPATGFSVGVSRLAAALKYKNKLDDDVAVGPVVVTVMDRERLADYQKMVAELREGLNKDRKTSEPVVPVEMYLGTSGMKAQLKYADRRNAPVAIIAGSQEFDRKEGPVVQIKDLIAGKARASAIEGHDAWRDERPGQFEIDRADLVAEVNALLEKQRGG